MISRCPSCGIQVDDEAKQCPKCYWDFALFKRVPPPEKAAPAPEAKPPEAKAPPPKPPEAKPPELKPPPANVVEEKAPQAKASAPPQFKSLPPPPPPPSPEDSPPPLYPKAQKPAAEKSVRPAPQAPGPEAQKTPAEEYPQGDWPPPRPVGGGLGFAIPVLPKTPAPPPIIGPIMGLGGVAAASEKKSPPEKETTAPPAAKPASPSEPSKEAPPAKARTATPQAGGSWGSPGAPAAPGGRGAVSRPATQVVPQPMRTSRPLAQWLAIGALAVGLLFVVATWIALRPEPEGRIPRSSSPTVFPKDSRPDGAKVLAPLEQIIASEAGKAAPAPSASTAAAVSAPTPPAPQAQPAPAPAQPVTKPEPPAPAPAQPAPAPAQPAAGPVAKPAPPAHAAQAPAAAPSVPPEEMPQSVASAPPVPASGRPAPRPRSSARWVFEGSVYDLISLQPVYAAKLTFKDASGKVGGETSTGDGGRYRIALEALAEGSYSLSVRHPDYREKYIDEINPPFRELSAEDRRGLVDMASRARPWMGQGSASTRRDFVMIPKLVAE